MLVYRRPRPSPDKEAFKPRLTKGRKRPQSGGRFRSLRLRRAKKSRRMAPGSAAGVVAMVAVGIALLLLIVRAMSLH